MAAVAAEPGAAAVPTTTTAAATDDEGPPEPGSAGSGLPGPPLDLDGPAVEPAAPRAEDGADGEERRHVRPELEPAAGKAPSESSTGDELTLGSGARVGTDRFSPGGGADQAAYRSVPADPQPSAVFLHSVPDPPPVTEAGLSLAEPAEPTTNVTTDRAETAGRDRDRGYTALVQPELRPGPAEEDGTADRPVTDPEPEPAYGMDCMGSEQLRDSSPPGRSPKRRLLAEDRPGPATAEPGPVQDLNPGSEVRVSLDHVIDDALVVSFRVGEKVFSGVLMDVSKRFGPYGIPITVFPRRDDRSRPQTSLQLPSDAGEAPPIKQEEVTVTPPSLSLPPPPNPWTSKPPPLFQEGAPYPPPLFIRDTYNQALPQPPPRKIKRPKRRYRCEEPTSIMNAIKLRPRQVLCDKCKGVVSAGGHREARRGPVDLRGEEASRRRRAPEVPLCAELKRLRTDDRGGRGTADRRPASGIRVSSSSSSSSSASSRRVLRGVASSSSSSPSSASRMRLKLNSKKVLSKERSKACQVLNKLARSTAPPHRRPKDQNQNHSQSQDQDQDRTKAVTRAAALQNHNQKVHFTRRLQHRSAASAAVDPSAALPPRMRLKPQRYRTDDTAPCPAPSSSCSGPSPPKHRPALSPAPCPTTDTPPASDTHASCVSTETDTACPAEEEGVESDRGVEPPSSSSSSLDSAPSECGSTETFDLPPPGSAPLPPPEEEEEEEDGSDLKRRRKSSSSSSSVFSKSVSKCRCPDGRTVCVGDIVWAKIYGFPWWPARVLGITVSRRGDTGLAVRQEARVSWFGSPTTSFLPLAQLTPFLESFQSRFDRKRKGPYRRAIAEAASAAKQLTPEVRALLTQFET